MIILRTALFCLFISVLQVDCKKKRETDFESSESNENSEDIKQGKHFGGSFQHFSHPRVQHSHFTHSKPFVSHNVIHSQPVRHFGNRQNGHVSQRRRTGFKHRNSHGSSFSHFSPPQPSSSHSSSRFSVFAKKNVHGQSPRKKTKILQGNLVRHFRDEEKPHRPHKHFRGSDPVRSFNNAIHPGRIVGHKKSSGFTPAKPIDGFAHPNHNVFPKIFPQKSICPGNVECKAIVQCAPFYYFLLQQADSECTLSSGAQGVCCPYFVDQGSRTSLFHMPTISVPIRRFTYEEINEAVEEGLIELSKRDDFDRDLIRRNIVVSNRKRPEFFHLQFFRSSPATQGIGRNGLKIVLTSESLVKRFNLNRNQAAFGLEEFNVQRTQIGNTCPAPIACNRKDDFYRRINGACNNLGNGRLGSANTGFNRILPPQYGNGLESPRSHSKVGVRLPSARVVSISNVVDADRPDPFLSLFVMQWGQFIDHDLTHVPIRRFGKESGVECCNEEGQFIQNSLSHPSCFPIELPHDDPFFRKFNRRCMNFVRSEVAPKDNCTLGFKEQMNQVTHYLDGSAVYGSSEEDERKLRAFRGGLLATQNAKFLPLDSGEGNDCGEETSRPNSCFVAGDSRVNEQPDLTVVHTLWVRQHNRIANMLSKLNPHWSDETVYQETRRIVVAQIQHITYNEWLPLILGTDFSLKTGLLPLKEGFSNKYDSGLDSRILNEFATVAFRFGHTLIDGWIRLFDKNHRETGRVRLHDHFNTPGILFNNGKLEEFLRGLFKQPMQKFDNFVTESITNRLFQTKDHQFGMDLLALNIQRGRDHGVATYNDLRAACGLRRATRFSDFRDLIHPEIIETFKLLYPTVDDVDPFIAGISERPAEGAVVGPLFRCIIADQFQRLRRGDRFFYDNGGQISSFTDAQLYEIRKTSLARILCENGMHIKEVQPLAFRLPGPLNHKTSCSSESIPSLDFAPWIAERH